MPIPFYRLLGCTVILLVLLVAPMPALAQPSTFPVPAELAGAVEFWKLIFRRYDSSEVVLFDPVDPTKIYAVVRAPETEQGRALVAKERARMVSEYDLADDEARIRSQRGARNHFVEGLRVSGRYIAEMEQIFRTEGVPRELVYLPLVESSFNHRARSSAGAVGMWQFMPETGRKFLRIDTAVDERRDPLASTRAAARLLKQNFRILGNWPLAITAYNHGTEGILRGMRAVESDDLVDLIRAYQSPTFGFASKNFYAEFVAAVEVATNRDSYFPFLRRHPPLKLREVPLKRPAAIHALLRPSAITEGEFFAWNPALEPNLKVLPVDYRVRLPAEKVESFLAAQRRSLDAPKAKRLSAVGAKNLPVKRERSVTRASAPGGAAGKAKSTSTTKRQPART